MISFTPLAAGARSDYSQPLAYILEIDDVKILLDCGSPDWHPEDDLKAGEDVSSIWEEYCAQLQSHAPSIDLVLLSHGDLAHSGLYAYAYSHWGLTATTYTTLPVQAMARIATLEEVTDLRGEEDVDAKTDSPKKDADEMDTTSSSVEQRKRRLILVPTTEQVNEAFQSILTLRYSQPTHLAGKCHGITIIPFAAGHTIGGTIWKIRSPSAGTLVYAVNLNHQREQHLDGSVLTLPSGGGMFEPLARPDVLITDAERASTSGGRRKDRNKALLDLISNTISSGHSLLLPIDSSTRLLELLVLTDQHWAYSRIRAPICLISNTAKELLALVRSMMEWLGGTISKEDVGESQKTTRRRRGEDEDEALGALALRFKFIEIFTSPDQLIDKFSSRDPKLILAVPASLSYGPSRSLFADFAAVEGNVVVLTGRGGQGTLNRFLMDRWEAGQEESQRWQDGKLGEPIPLDRPIELELRSKILLQGAELEKFREDEKLAKEKAAAEKAAAARKQQMREEEAQSSDSDSDDSDDSDSGEEGAAEMKNQLEGMDWTTGEVEDSALKQMSFDIYVKGHQTKTSNFFKPSDTGAPRYRMFPFVEKRRRFDDFGEIIDVSSWLRKGRVLDQVAESEEVSAMKLKKVEQQKAPEEAPSKFITERINIQMKCKIYFVDLEGVHDGRALKNILPHVNPRRLIIVQASSEATDSLLDACRATRSMTTEIYAPQVGETVRVGEDMRNFTIALSDALMSAIKMSTYEDSEIAFVKGRVSIPTNSGVPVLEPMRIMSRQGEDNAMEVDGTSQEVVVMPRAVMIGDLKLTSLKVRLSRLGISADFAGEGILVCRSAVSGDEEDTVAVRKTRKGQVRVEGDASSLFYTVREEIYKLHALVETE